jgi:hypothetical protein
MISLSGIAFSLIAIVTAFFSPLAAWIILGSGECFLLLLLMGTKRRTHQYQYQGDLSAKANIMLKKFRHYYDMPIHGTIFY